MNWSKKKCIEYIQQMKSPIEEISPANQQPQTILDRLRMAAQKAKTTMGIPERGM